MMDLNSIAAFHGYVLNLKIGIISKRVGDDRRIQGVKDSRIQGNLT